MLKKILKKILIIILLLPLVFAYDSELNIISFGDDQLSIGNGNFGDDQLNIILNNLPSSFPVVVGGGGNPISGNECSYNWVCTNWFPEYCPESGYQERVCVNTGTCIGIENIPLLKRECVYEGPKEPLFDIFLSIPWTNQKVCAGDEIKINIKLENYGKIELLDAFMSYWIIDENNKLISELKDTRSIEDKMQYSVKLKIPNIVTEGIYRVYSQISYGENKTALAGESFEILNKEHCIFNKYASYSVIFILVFIIMIFLHLLFNGLKRKTKNFKNRKKA